MRGVAAHLPASLTLVNSPPLPPPKRAIGFTVALEQRAATTGLRASVELRVWSEDCISAQVVLLRHRSAAVKLW